MSRLRFHLRMDAAIANNFTPVANYLRSFTLQIFSGI
jgi:hypothetical protein